MKMSRRIVFGGSILCSSLEQHFATFQGELLLLFSAQDHSRTPRISAKAEALQTAWNKVMPFSWREFREFHCKYSILLACKVGGLRPDYY
jgi:hypothetical protein